MKRLHKWRVPKMFYDYSESGSWTESTFVRNESVFNEILLRQRVAVDLLPQDREVVAQVLQVNGVERSFSCRQMATLAGRKMEHSMFSAVRLTGIVATMRQRQLISSLTAVVSSCGSPKPQGMELASVESFPTEITR